MKMGTEMAFAWAVASTVVAASNRAISQALERDAPPLTKENVTHYTNTIREFLDAIDQSFVE